LALFISRDGLKGWLGEIGRTRELIAPTAVEGLVLFQEADSPEALALDYEFSPLSPKGVFLPQSEVIFRVKEGMVEPPPEEGEKVLFGLRPCDARGVYLLDLPFLEPPADPRYRLRRERTALIALACTGPRPECFCTSMGTGPQDPSHSDILLTPLDEGYVVAPTTEKGRALVSSGPFTEREVAVPPAPEPPRLPTENLPQLALRLFNHDYWERLADRCIQCNLCSYVCPACYCFDIRDYQSGGAVERIRSWDSCQSAGFVRLAGGYDPRASKGARLRQRFYHKFLYFPQQFGALGCTGCGRCVRVCPVNIDIREVIAEMAKLGAEN